MAKLHRSQGLANNMGLTAAAAGRHHIALLCYADPLTNVESANKELSKEHDQQANKVAATQPDLPVSALLHCWCQQGSSLPLHLALLTARLYPMLPWHHKWLPGFSGKVRVSQLVTRGA